MAQVLVRAIATDCRYGRDRAGGGWLPVCILAQGRTRAALESLLREGNLADLIRNLMSELMEDLLGR